VILTLGHSIRPLDQTLALLKENRVTLLADVRTLPRSRRNPQYDSAAFAAALEEIGIGYRHLPKLGGMRKPRPDSVNQGLKEDGFRGYADYMQTPEFESALDLLVSLATDGQLAYMCAEAKPLECHRSLISDALMARGIEIRHILGPGDTAVHVYTRHAEVRGNRVMYPFKLEG
jgi:uncharacterized protein (DUF488 family)